MKLISKWTLNSFASVLVMATALQLSTASIWLFHQPKVPQK